MIAVFLTLDVISTGTASLGAGRRRTFGPEGGMIGRDPGSDWVLPHRKVSARHARVFADQGAFCIEDRSTNGVYIGATRERLAKGRPHRLRAGDRLFIEPYEILVSIADERPAADELLPSRPSRANLPGLPQDAHDPFASGDPFAGSRPGPQMSPASGGAHDEVAAGQEVDPLKLLDPGSSSRRRDAASSADDLNRASLLSAHYQPPSFVAPVDVAPRSTFEIPPDYDPLAPDSVIVPRAPTPGPPPVEEVVEEEVISREMSPAPAASPPDQGPPPSAEADEPAVSAPAEAHALEPARESVAVKSDSSPSGERSLTPPQRSDLAELLAGAGLPNAEVSEQLARDFGKILSVVVSGIMDVLRARQQIKDELRMRTTQFKKVDNNPLKFSANVEDALHNLLVKRNAAYLAPVEAFEDAFDDVRDHQLAMLAGMRAAFEALLAEFDPDRLQEKFDRQLKRGALINVPARLRYWDLYREHANELMAEPEVMFRKLLGDVFVRAYEEQLARLEAGRVRMHDS